jgi:hypothetical protein
MADQSRSQWSVPRHKAVYDLVIPLARYQHLAAPKVTTNLAHLKRLEKGGMNKKWTGVFYARCLNGTTAPEPAVTSQ